MEYERWILEEDILDFEFDGRGYRFEPEYTVEELRQMEMEMEARAMEAPQTNVTAETVSRITGTWWCACGKCRQMPTEVESMCCKEWDLLVSAGMASLDMSDETDASPSCVTDNEVRLLINRPGLETFFWVPKINWKKLPRPEGPNGQLSQR